MSFGTNEKNTNYKDLLPPLVVLYDALSSLRIPKSLAYDLQIKKKLTNIEEQKLAPDTRNRYYAEWAYDIVSNPSYQQREESVHQLFEPFLALMHPKFEIPDSSHELIKLCQIEQAKKRDKWGK